jgi:hypothetical protein
MRHFQAAHAAAWAAVTVVAWNSTRALGQFEPPVYFNMGGPAFTDSQGRLWRGDQGAGDPNNIRPNDAGGANTIEAWCSPSPESLAALGLTPADAVPLQSIRWDNGADAIDYALEIPLAAGSYDVELYLCEACCPGRHFSITIEGATAFPDVSSGLYAGGASHVAGRLVAEGVEVADGLLNITLLPCLDPACPGGGDPNSILSALGIKVHIPEPLYFNMGGPAFTDSQGRFWRGDQGAGLDPNNIRPDDAGGANTIEAWCSPSPESLAAIGLTPADAVPLQSIRWDNGGDAIDYTLRIPVEPFTYDVELYLCEACCPFRHFSIAIEGATTFPDVSSGLYAGGASHVAGRLVAEGLEIADGFVDITLLPCFDPACPGGADGNSILSALAIVPEGLDPCDQEGFGLCPSGLELALDGMGNVTATWNAPQCAMPSGYTVLKDGAVLTVLDGSATGFIDVLGGRAARYEVITEGGGCGPLSSLAVDVAAPFAIPARINMGGPTRIDSRGRQWLGDGPGPGDPLSIRPNDGGGVNTIENWCVPENQGNSSLAILGLDPFSAANQHIFNTIRWDIGDDDADGLAGGLNDPGGDIDYLLELPVPNGVYLVNLYFTECCCATRVAHLEVEGVVVDPQLGISDHGTGQLARTGRISAGGIAVADGILNITLRPCAGCSVGAGNDVNPILNAIEVLPDGSPNPICPHALACTQVGDDTVVLNWSPAMDIDESDFDGYEVYRNGSLVALLGPDADEYTDDSGCARVRVYEVVPLTPFCLGARLSCSVTNTTCAFESPVRINMGGDGTFDSAGRFWAGDPGVNADVLGIRPDDLGGGNADVNWGIGNLRPESLAPLGFDPASAVDRTLMSTIRWDNAGDVNEYRLVLPVENGLYAVNLYLCENFWNPPELRGFRLEIQDEVVDGNVNAHDFSPSNPVTGWAGRLRYEDVPVGGGSLRLALLPCDTVTECPGVPDRNAILNLLEVEKTAELPGVLERAGDCDLSGGRDILDIICEIRVLFPGFILGESGPPPLLCETVEGTTAILDVNGDAIYNVSDIVFLSRYLFMSGPPPAQGAGCFEVPQLVGCPVNPGCL